MKPELAFRSYSNLSLFTSLHEFSGADRSFTFPRGYPACGYTWFSSYQQAISGRTFHAHDCLKVIRFVFCLLCSWKFYQLYLLHCLQLYDMWKYDSENL